MTKRELIAIIEADLHWYKQIQNDAAVARDSNGWANGNAYALGRILTLVDLLDTGTSLEPEQLTLPFMF